MTEDRRIRMRIEQSWNEAKDHYQDALWNAAQEIPAKQYMAKELANACPTKPKDKSVRVILEDADSTLTDTLGLLHRIYGAIRAEENTLCKDNEPPRDMTDAALTLADKAGRLLDVVTCIAVALGV